jgi:hypothetical protein
MKTTYKVIEAHSSTSEKEIRKAKREFLKKVKTGEIPNWAKGETIELHFSDENYCITVNYIVSEYGSIGSTVIYNSN